MNMNMLALVLDACIFTPLSGTHWIRTLLALVMTMDMLALCVLGVLPSSHKHDMLPLHRLFNISVYDYEGLTNCHAQQVS